MKTLKHETIISGDFNINPLENDNAKTDYCNVLKAYDVDVRNSLPTRVSPTSRSCNDHLITRKSVETESIKITISNHYSVLAQFYSETTNPSQMTKMIRYLQPMKGEKSLNILFLLDQKLKDLVFGLSINEQVVSISKTIMKCVEIFVPKNR